MKKTTCLLVASLIITNLLGCAHPTIVESIQTGDYDMTCIELTMAITEAKRFKAEARTKKGFTGGNVARGILLWPTILGTYSNVNEAVQAADNRIAHLSRIKEEKCGHMAENTEPSDKNIQVSSKEELLLWVKVKENNTTDMYEIYLSMYPNGIFGEDAQTKLNELNMQKQDENIENKKGK
ncbi:MAG: hypothetical protein ACUZ8I_12440 [Candidatus Scalindua sp.]